MNYYLIKIKQLINNFAVGPECGSCGVCVCVCERERERVAVLCRGQESNQVG